MADAKTTDIVTRLREETNGGGLLRWCPPQLANEAADEIERLRGWLSYIEGRHGPMDEAAAIALAGEPLPEGFNP